MWFCYVPYAAYDLLLTFYICTYAFCKVRNSYVVLVYRVVLQCICHILWQNKRDFKCHHVKYPKLRLRSSFRLQPARIQTQALTLLPAPPQLNLSSLKRESMSCLKHQRKSCTSCIRQKKKYRLLYSAKSLGSGSPLW